MDSVSGTPDHHAGPRFVRGANKKKKKKKKEADKDRRPGDGRRTTDDVIQRGKYHEGRRKARGAHICSLTRP